MTSAKSKIIFFLVMLLTQTTEESVTELVNVVNR